MELPTKAGIQRGSPGGQKPTSMPALECPDHGIREREKKNSSLLSRMRIAPVRLPQRHLRICTDFQIIITDDLMHALLI